MTTMLSLAQQQFLLSRASAPCGRSVLLCPPPLVLGQQTVRTSKISKRRKDTQRRLAPHLAFKPAEKRPTDYALAYFDDHYGKVFQRRWHSMRLALLSRQKHCALINNFDSDPDEVRRRLSQLGCISVRDVAKDKMNQATAEEVAAAAPSPAENVPRPLPSHVREILEAEEEDPSMPLQEDVIRGRLIDPAEQVIGDHHSASALYDFVPTKTLKGMEDFVEESDYYDSYRKLDQFPVDVRPDLGSTLYPDALDAYVFPAADLSLFPPPRPGVVGTYDYFCLDAASLLPVVALGLRPGQSLLDMCAAPGGKSLAALQTLMPGRIVCNDHSAERLVRVSRIVDMYLKDVGKMRKKVQYKRTDARSLPVEFPNFFDKVLCDVPCTTDRHVLHESDNSLFHPKRKTQRIQITELQTELLVSALKCTRPGGSVVYSTCALSPMQNDGVVHSALKNIWEETSIEYYINDLTHMAEAFSPIVPMAGKDIDVKYGQLVMPNINNNFGPMYIAKITRTK